MKLRIKPTILRVIILSLLILAQLALFAHTIWTTSRLSVFIQFLLPVVSLFVVLYIVRSNTDPSFKITWSILILLVPLFGGLFYLFFGLQPSSRRFRRRINGLDRETREFRLQPADVAEDVSALRGDLGRHIGYLTKTAGFPVYRKTRVEYLTSGEAKFLRLKEELTKANEFIFLEYFIIEEGYMWNTLLDILAAKAAAGVDVRVMYDGIGCLLTLPWGYKRKLQDLGIRCTVFNPAKAVPSTLLNHRDHRKIVVIDGRIAFTGGVNLADEYINRVDKYGHWKDAAVFLSGDAVDAFTLMFLTLWNLHNRESGGYKDFLRASIGIQEDKMFCQPYADSPMDDERVGEAVFMNIINTARKYVYITTPYLIISHTIMTALTLAAKSEIDVRIITPRHWDKRFVHMATRSYYDELVSAGVKIYEYKDGFMHAKTLVSDDIIAVVGTTNLDYRSLYLHYECGVLLYGGRAILDLRDDFLSSQEQSDPVYSGQYSPKTTLGRMFLHVLRLFAPLL